MIRVLDLATGYSQMYTLPAVQAVIAAYEQAKGNWNTWNYSSNHPLLEFGPSGRTVFCGQFGTMLDSLLPDKSDQHLRAIA